MLTPDQIASFTADALSLLATNPGLLHQEFRAKVHALVGGGDDWRDSDSIVLQDLVILAQQKAYAAADQAAKDAIEAKIMAEWQARMDAPVQAAPVYATTVTPTAPLTYSDKIEAVKTLYGEDCNLRAAVDYALAHDLSADDVASNCFISATTVREMMYPVR